MSEQMPNQYDAEFPERRIEKKESPELLPYFPTDLERAEVGLKKFNEAFEKSEVLRKATEDGTNSRMLYCTAGLYPETGFYWGGGFRELDTESEREELKRVYEEELGLKVLHWQREKEGEKWDVSLLNPASVDKIIKNSPVPNLFPEEARKSPMEWVLNNPSEWADLENPIHTARFGAMSGYPPLASSVFREYLAAQEKFIDGVLSTRERMVYYKYANSNRHERKLSKNLENKLKKSVDSKLLTPKQGELIKSYFGNTDELEMFGEGFFDEDEKYFDNIKTVLDKLGIKDKITA